MASSLRRIATCTPTRAAYPQPMRAAVNQHRSFIHGDRSTYLVTPSELDAALQRNIRSKLSTAPRVVPLCATWFLPNDPMKRDGFSSFKATRIPHARFLDLDAVKDAESPYPHMLPSPADFAAAVGALGIRRDDEVVVYDDAEQGIFSAPRVGWMFRVFGHPGVRILNNFRLWCEQGYPTDSGMLEPFEGVHYPVPEMNASMVVGFAEMKEIARQRWKEGRAEIQIADARPQGRWAGNDPEPRPDLPSGHIPRSTSVPFAELLDPTTKALRGASELKMVFEAKGIDLSKPIITTCGTGVTAAVVDAALAEVGVSDERRRLYDGSWTEWAQRVDPEEDLVHRTSD